MRPQRMAEEQDQGELFRSRLEQILDPGHPLLKLAGTINWRAFEEACGPLCADDVGRPGLPIRLLVGLHYLKHMYDVSDEAVVARWIENLYWQAFCGYEYFEHEQPCDPTSLVKWRHRVGAEGVETLLKETLEAAKRGKALKPREVRRVKVDTTVQEKAVAFPTDARLYHKARRVGIELRQSYERVGRRALQRQGRYAHAQQMRRARRETRQLRRYLGCVIRDIRRNCPDPDERLATTSKQGWGVGIDTAPGNPYDGATLGATLDQVKRMTGTKPEQAFVDKGYRGGKHHPEDVEVYVSGRRGLSRTLKALLRRRSAIEAAIRHLKLDGRMDRNYLMGAQGDRINAMLSGCGFNLWKLMRKVVFLLLRWLGSCRLLPQPTRFTVISTLQLP